VPTLSTSEVKPFMTRKVILLAESFSGEGRDSVPIEVDSLSPVQTPFEMIHPSPRLLHADLLQTVVRIGRYLGEDG
jgi:hypothetical protein